MSAVSDNMVLFFKNLKANQLREMRFIVVVMIGLECVSRDEQ